MYLPILRELERLQAELSKADPADETRARDAVRAMAAHLRRLDTRAAPAAAKRRPAAHKITRRA